MRVLNFKFVCFMCSTALLCGELSLWIASQCFFPAHFLTLDVVRRLNPTLISLFSKAWKHHVSQLIYEAFFHQCLIFYFLWFFLPWLHIALLSSTEWTWFQLTFSSLCLCICYYCDLQNIDFQMRLFAGTVFKNTCSSCCSSLDH